MANRYQILEVVGIGGMGSVYRARDLHFPNVSKQVAVKEMVNTAPDPVVRQTVLENLEREANILVTLHHKSIPDIFDFFTLNDRSYLILEFVNGQDLEAIMSRSNVPFIEEQVISWAMQICDVLDYLHAHKPDPIIFRDIKPSNIMIDSDNQVVLVDFGIAKHLRTGQKGTMIGTEGYSPPEQYRGEATIQTDIYSLGATLHHLLTNRDPRLEAPFSFKDWQIRTINPAISSELEAIVDKALEYDPDRRFKSALEMKQALIALARRTGKLPPVNHSVVHSSQDAFHLVWTYKTEDEIRGTASTGDGVVYFGSYDKKMYSINCDTCELRWNFLSGGAIVSKPLLIDKQVIFGSEDGHLYSLNSRLGQKQWSFKTGSAIRCSPRAAEGYIFIGSDDKILYSINLASNQASWSYLAEGSIRSTPFLTVEFVYFGSEANEFICLNYRGQQIWKQWTRKPVTSSPTVRDGIVYFASLDGLFYALDAASGWVFWRFRMGKGSVSSPVVNDDLVFFGCADGCIYAIDRTQAREIWHFKTGGQVCGSPIINDKVLYCASTDGNLYALNSDSGRLLKQFSTPAAITGTPVIADDLIFIGSLDYTLYALKIS